MLLADSVLSRWVCGVRIEMFAQQHWVGHVGNLACLSWLTGATQGRVNTDKEEENENTAAEAEGGARERQHQFFSWESQE